MYYIDSLDESTSLIVAGVFALVYLVILALAFVNYIMTALSLYTIAKRRDISNPWMAWIPYVNVWTLGSIVKQYDSKNGINRKWNVVLLTLELLTVGSAVAIFAVIIGSAFSTLMLSENFYPDTEWALGLILPLIVLYFVSVFISLVYLVCSYICTYKVFESTVPEKSLKYFIISAIVPLGSGICLMLCRNKGYGKEATPQSPVYYNTAPQAMGNIPDYSDSPFDNPFAEAPQNNQENSEDNQ